MAEPTDLTHLTEDEARDITKLLLKHKNAIAQNKLEIGKCDLIEHHINTSEHAPTATRQWPLPHATRAAMKEQCNQLSK